MLGGDGPPRRLRAGARPSETQGVNDRWQLALAERELRARTNRHWLLNGVTMLDPRQTFIDVTVKLGRDVTLYPGTILQGQTVVGDGCEIGPDTRLVDCVVGARTAGRSTPSGVDAEIGDGATRRPVRPPASRVRRSPRRRRPGRSTLQARRLIRPTRDHGERRPDGEGHHQEAGALLRAGPTPSWPRRSPTTSASSSATPNIVEFANGEIRPRFAESVRGNDVFIIQSHYGVDGRSINDSIMEQLIMIDAAYRASAKRITAVCPFYGYARQDRKAEGREPITARLVADMFKAAGAKRMISIDLHAGQIQGFFDGPVDHLTAMPVLEDYLREQRHGAGDRVARRRAHQGRRADGPAPRRLRRRPGVHLQAPARRARPTSPRRPR